MFCTQCGAPVPGGAKFCPSCGAPTGEIPASPQQPAHVPERTPVSPQPVQIPAAPVQAAIPAVQPVQAAVATAAAAKGLSKAAKLLIALLLAGVLSGGVYVVYLQATADPDAGIKETVQNLEVAYNRTDINGMLDCFDPAYTAIYKGAISLAGSMMDVDLGAMMDGLFGLAAVLPAEELGMEDMPALDLAVNAVNYLSDYDAEVSLTVTFSQGGQSQTGDLIVRMIRKDKTWYFSGENLF